MIGLEFDDLRIALGTTRFLFLGVERSVPCALANARLMGAPPHRRQPSASVVFFRDASKQICRFMLRGELLLAVLAVSQCSSSPRFLTHVNEGDRRDTQPEWISGLVPDGKSAAPRTSGHVGLLSPSLMARFLLSNTKIAAAR